MEEEIIYAVIAKGEKPLVEYSNYTGSFRQQCIEQLSKIERNSSKAIQIDDTIIFYLNDAHTNLTFLAMAGKKYPKATAVGFLNDVQKTFTNQFNDRDFDVEEKFGLNNQFKDTLREKIKYYNENKEVTSANIKELSNKMNDLKNEVITTAGLVDERGDKIKNLDEKSEGLLENSNNYYRESVKARKRECWNKYKLYVGIGVAVLVIVGIIVLITVTGDD
jgi:hypothetical protein